MQYIYIHTVTFYKHSTHVKAFADCFNFFFYLFVQQASKAGEIKKYKTAASNRLAGQFENKNKSGKMRILNINAYIPKRTRTVVKSAVKLEICAYKAARLRFCLISIIIILILIIECRRQIYTYYIIIQIDSKLS